MNDLRAVQVADVIPVHRVSVSPLTYGAVRLEGRGMDGVASVRVNGTDVRFVVLSETTVDAMLPDALASVAVRSIDVLSARFTGTDRSRIEPTISGRASSISGILKLIQQYITVLFTTPGSNIFRPEEGGGLLRLLGSTIDQGNPASYTSVVLTAVEKTNRDVVKSQITRRLPDVERLRGAQIVDVFYNSASTSLLCTLRFETFAGQQVLAAVGAG